MKTKVITTLMIVLFLASMLSLTKPVIAPPPPGMISYWRLDEGSGTIAYDSVGTNDGSVTNPNWSLYGMVGGCIQSSPRGSTYARVSNSLSLNVPGDQLTVEAWVYLFGSSYLEGQGNAGYVAAKDISEGYLSYGLLVGGWWRGLFQFTVETIENGWRYVDSTIDFPAGTWFHMVGVYDGSQLRLYVNGVLNNVAAQSGTIASGPGPFWIGKYPGLNGYDWAYYGKIDEVAIYNRALSAEEIRQHYENGLKAPARIGSCDSAGIPKDIFQLSQGICVKGTGYLPSTTYSIYLVNDTTWIEGIPIPQRVVGTEATVSSDAFGNVSTTVLWNAPLKPGRYDIVVDVNGDGYYNASIDALDESYIQVKSGVFVVPEYWLGTILGLVGCFVALGVFRVAKRKRKPGD